VALLVLTGPPGAHQPLWGRPRRLGPPGPHAPQGGLVFYFFHAPEVRASVLKGVVLVTLGTLLVFFALLFSDVAFR